jgi:hypothetical protein
MREELAQPQEATPGDRAERFRSPLSATPRCEQPCVAGESGP